MLPYDTQTDVQPYRVSIEYVRRITLQTMRREKRRTFIPLQPTRIPPDMLVRQYLYSQDVGTESRGPPQDFTHQLASIRNVTPLHVLAGATLVRRPSAAAVPSVASGSFARSDIFTAVKPARTAIVFALFS